MTKLFILEALRKYRILVVIAALFFAVSFTFFILETTGNPAVSSSLSTEDQAFLIAMDYVEASLDLPKEYEFSELDEDSVLTNVSYIGDDTYSVRGRVSYDLPDDNWDIIREDYVVRLRELDGEWEVLDAEVINVR